MSQQGWIKLHRKTLENPWLKDSHFLAIWTFLLLEATHKNIDVLFGKKRITLKPGQLITSRKSIEKALKINQSKIERVLSRLKSEHQIEQQANSVSRLITITNWDYYQQSEHQNEQQVNSDRTASEHKQECKECKKETVGQKKLFPQAEKKRTRSLFFDFIVDAWGLKPDFVKKSGSRIAKAANILKANEPDLKKIKLVFESWSFLFPEISIPSFDKFSQNYNTYHSNLKFEQEKNSDKYKQILKNLQRKGLL